MAIKKIENNEKIPQLIRRADSAWTRVGSEIHEIISENEKNEFVRTQYGDWVPKKTVNKALELYAKVLEVEPTHLVTRFNRGIALDFLNRFDEAEKDLMWVINYEYGCEKNLYIYRILALRTIALEMLSVGKREQAEGFAQKCNEIVLAEQEPAALLLNLDQEESAIAEMKKNIAKKSVVLKQQVFISSEIETRSFQEIKQDQSEQEDLTVPLDKTIEKIFLKIEKRLMVLPQWQTGNPNWREETSKKEIEHAELAIKSILKDIKNLQENYPNNEKVLEFCKSASYFL
jgi:hypothetical protein